MQQNLWLKKKKQLWNERLNSDGLWRDKHKNVTELKELCSISNVFLRKRNALALWLLSALLSSSDFSSHIFMPLNIDTYGLWASIWSYLYVLRGIDITVFHTWGVHPNQYTTLAVISIPFSCSQRVIYNHLT